MKKTTRKLTLAKTTVRSLSETTLEQAAGGSWRIYTGENCGSRNLGRAQVCYASNEL